MKISWYGYFREEKPSGWALYQYRKCRNDTLTAESTAHAANCGAGVVTE